MFKNLIQRYHIAKEERRNLRNAKRRLEDAIETVRQLTQAYDETITDIRKELDQESHAATTRKALDQSWRRAIKSRDNALDSLIANLKELQKAYETYQSQGGPKRYDIEDLLDVKQYQYSDNVHGLVTEIAHIGQIVANMKQDNID